jgi:hypothetical protein
MVRNDDAGLRDVSMRRVFMVLVFVGWPVAAQQTPTKPDLLKLTDQLESAIVAGDWKQSAALSSALKDEVRDARNRSMSANANERVDSILGWLPLDTETIIVAQEPFTLIDDHENENPKALAMAQGYAVGLLAAAENEKLHKALLGRTIRLAAAGARAFGIHPPDERGAIPLGLIAYQGCAAYVFAEPIAESSLSRPPDESLMGHPMWVSKGSQNDRPETDTYLVAILKPDLLIVCNNRDFLTTMVSRMASPQKGRALPADLPEWKQLDRHTPFWAVRHYHSARENTDPTNAAYMLKVEGDPEAVGLIVEFGLASHSAVARMISKSDPWKHLSGNQELHGAAQSRELAKGVWELSISGKPEAAMMSVFALMAVLGFAVFV